MAGNTFGTILRLTTFGESHGPAIGGILDGIPAGLEVDMDLLQRDLARRRPGQSRLVSPRDEKDQVELLSGVFEGITLGTPIGFLIRNQDQRPGDYDKLKDLYRPSHADLTYELKYGIRDHRGGGRASARETVARVVAGAFAKMLLRHFGVSVKAFVNTIGTVSVTKPYGDLDLDTSESSMVRCPDPDASKKMIELIDKTREAGDTLGGIIQCVVSNLPAGLGEPVFDRLHADLARAMMGINAVKGFEIGAGFNASGMKGSEHNDSFVRQSGKLKTETNFSAGIQGGISNGEDIYFRVAFKPVATLMQSQKTVDRSGKKVHLEAKGRHDVCVVPRAVPIVEAMAALTLADHLLRNRSARL